MYGVQKSRVTTLDSLDLRQTMWQHIRENAKKKDIFIDFVNGHAEHCHCLISLGVDQTIAKVMQLVKGEGAFWFNKEKLTKQKLEWQDEYIKNQESHHKHKTFRREYDELISKFGYKKFSD